MASILSTSKTIIEGRQVHPRIYARDQYTPILDWPITTRTITSCDKSRRLRHTRSMSALYAALIHQQQTAVQMFCYKRFRLLLIFGSCIMLTSL